MPIIFYAQNRNYQKNLHLRCPKMPARLLYPYTRMKGLKKDQDERRENEKWKRNNKQDAN